MKDLDIIKIKINKLRQEINNKIAEGKDLNANEILTLSQRLDTLIIQWYKVNGID